MYIIVKGVSLIKSGWRGCGNTAISLFSLQVNVNTENVFVKLTFTTLYVLSSVDFDGLKFGIRTLHTILRYDDSKTNPTKKWKSVFPILLRYKFCHNIIKSSIFKAIDVDPNARFKDPEIKMKELELYYVKWTIWWNNLPVFSVDLKFKTIRVTRKFTYETKNTIFKSTFEFLAKIYFSYQCLIKKELIKLKKDCFLFL